MQVALALRHLHEPSCPYTSLTHAKWQRQKLKKYTNPHESDGRAHNTHRDFVTLATLDCLLSACADTPLKNNNVPCATYATRAHSTPNYGNVCKVQFEWSRMDRWCVRRKQKIVSHDTETWYRMNDSQTTDWLDRWMSTHIARRYRLLCPTPLCNVGLVKHLLLPLLLMRWLRNPNLELEFVACLRWFCHSDRCEVRNDWQIND